MVEYLGAEEEAMIEFIIRKVEAKARPDEMFNELESFLDPAIREVDKCMREGATIICGDVGQTTAPDEDTARRVIELFKKSRGEVRCVTLPWNAFAQ